MQQQFPHGPNVSRLHKYFKTLGQLALFLRRVAELGSQARFNLGLTRKFVISCITALIFDTK
jgi:hypothetical protein